MRISDWSSDVCSSDLAPEPDARHRLTADHICKSYAAPANLTPPLTRGRRFRYIALKARRRFVIKLRTTRLTRNILIGSDAAFPRCGEKGVCDDDRLNGRSGAIGPDADRKSVVEGKSVSERVDLG